MNEGKPAPSPSPSGRLMSLDAFRGMVILGMLLVNNIALGDYTPRALAHAPWNQGATFADMIFPWFILIVGVAIPFSAASTRNKGKSFSAYLLKALKRAIILVLAGCFLDSSIARSPVFSLGILQVIGISYFITVLFTGLKTGWRLAAASAMLLGYWAAIRFWAVPGPAAGIFTEEMNFVKYANQMFFEPYHLRGLLSIIPATALSLIGTAVGEQLRREAISPWKRALTLMAGGIVMTGLAILWNLDLPFNKTVFTPSYALLAAGLGTTLLSFFYLAIDVTRGRTWALFLVVPGTNAILAYVLPIIVKVYVLQIWTWKMPDGSTVNLQQALMNFFFQKWGRLEGGWLYTLVYIFIWWLVFLAFYRKKIFWRI